MIALLKKETVALAPYWGAFAVLVAVNTASLLWSVDYVLDPLGVRLSNGEANAGTLWILSFLVGHGRVAHEFRDGHMEFLDALPVHRLQVFTAKFLACALPCLGLVVSSLVMDLGFLTVARPLLSTGGVQPIVVMHTVMVAAALGGLGVGMLLSWVGPLAWGVLGVTTMVAVCAGTIHPPVEAWVPLVGSFGRLEWQADLAVHPIGPPVLVALVGTMGVAASCGLFLGPGTLLTNRGSRAEAAVRVGLIGCGGAMVLPLAALFALGILIEHAGDLIAGKRSLDTASFRILYAPGDEGEAEALATKVDALSVRVGALVGNADPINLDIELLGAPDNHLGVFTGGKIRLANAGDLHTLAHELTHAHAFFLAGPAGWSQHDPMHFFDEGLADWVTATIEGEPGVPQVAGAIRLTGQGRFEDLVDHQAFIARHDIRQSYALGQAFVSALVDVEGPEAPGCVLQAVSEVGDRTVAGLALWYGLAAACHIDLDEVKDRWVQQLEAAGASIEGPLPRLRASLAPDEASPVLRVRDEVARGWPLTCGFRDGPTTPVDRWVYMGAQDGQCRIPLGQLSGHTFQYQVGFRIPGGDDDDLRDVFLEWVDARRP